MTVASTPQSPELNVLQNLPSTSVTELRKSMITTILATDMSVHFEYLGKFQTKFIDAEAAPKNDEEKNFLVTSW